MGLADLSPFLVRQAALNGINSRQAGFPEDIVREIYRYGAPIGSRIEYLSEAERCMDVAKERIIACEEEGRSFATGTVFMAGELFGGMGRFRRSWHAPPGGIWLVTVLVNTLLPEGAGLYSLAAGVACCETVCHYGISAKLKWVNDVLVGGRKLAGILVESIRGPRYGEEYILLGIGLNVNNRDFPPELAGLAGAMSMFCGGELDLTQVGARLLADLGWNIGLLHFVERKQLAAGDQGAGTEARHPLLDSWRALSDTPGRRVCFGFNAIASPQFTASAIDIDRRGGLIMRLDDGRLVTENSGEIVYV